METNFLIANILASVTAVIAIVLIILIICHVKSKRNNKDAKKTKLLVIEIILAVCLVVCGFFVFQYKSYENACNEAIKKGAQQTYINTNFSNVNSTADIVATNKITPYDQSTTAYDLWISNKLEEGCEFILYRYDCDDCHSILPDLMSENKDNPNYYFVCTRTDDGKKLVNLWKELYKIPIQNVPSKITYHANGNHTYEELN